MIINKNLTKIRCLMNAINIETSLLPIDEQMTTLEDCLSPTVTFAAVRDCLVDAMANNEPDFEGWTDELANLLRNDEKLRGHDYLKAWFKHYFVLGHDANFIIADAATHNMLQNRLSYEQKNELLHLMRGRKHDPK